MEIKQALLQSEKSAVKAFLTSFDLTYREDVDYTVYIEEAGKIVGTVSLAGSVIMLLAIDKSMQGENLALKLVDHVISKLRADGKFGYRVFTKPEYLMLFIDMGFKLLVKTESFVALEGGTSDIEKAVDGLVNKVIMEHGFIDGDTAAIVINGNPFTKGHLALVEHALAHHRKLMIFVLEEDLSEFSFRERFSLAFVATRAYNERVSVLPSTEYIVSKETFPDYFLHGADTQTRAYAEYDALIFKKYFMPKLGIVKRYFGSEKVDYMQIYNEKMKEVLGEHAEVVERFNENGTEISAKTVRGLIKEGKREEALSLLPTATRAVMNLILSTKKW